MDSEFLQRQRGRQEVLKVLRKILEDRRAVWGSRLDKEQTKIRCPVFREESDLRKEFDELCAAYRTKLKRADKRKGGEPSSE